VKPKCTKFDFGWVSLPDRVGGAYSVPSPIAGFQEPTSKGEGGDGREYRRGKGRRREGRKGKEWERREGKGQTKRIGGRRKGGRSLPHNKKNRSRASDPTVFIFI